MLTSTAMLLHNESINPSIKALCMWDKADLPRLPEGTMHRTEPVTLWTTTRVKKQVMNGSRWEGQQEEDEKKTKKTKSCGEAVTGNSRSTQVKRLKQETQARLSRWAPHTETQKHIDQRRQEVTAFWLVKQDKTWSLSQFIVDMFYPSSEIWGWKWVCVCVCVCVCVRVFSTEQVQCVGVLAADLCVV